MTANDNKRKVVYTFIIGDYDDLKPPTIITPGWDYICFTDNTEIRSPVWDVRLSPRERSDRDLENKKFAMKHMILFHRYLAEYDLSLSIGAQLELNCNLDDLIQKYFQEDDDMMVCRHESRNCVFEEAEVCKDSRLDDPARIDSHMQRYRAIGYPANNGLYTTRIIARRHDRANLQEMCEFWWLEYQRGSRRDQLSFNYAIWASAPVKISAIDFDEQFVVARNFIIGPHSGKPRLNGVDIRLEINNTNLVNDGQSPASADMDCIGNIDGADSYGIRGWVADRNQLNTPINVSLFDGEQLLMTVLANQPRSDVGAALNDDGRHGFSFPPPDGLENGGTHKLSIRC